MKKGKFHKLLLNKNNECISIYYIFRKINQNSITIKRAVLPEMSSRRAGKSFAVEIYKKMLLETIRIL